MAGVDKFFESFTRLADFFAAHRTGNIEQNADGNRRVGIAEKRDFLFFAAIENGESLFRQTGNESPVKVGDGQRQRDQIGFDVQRFRVVFRRLRLLLFRRSRLGSRFGLRGRCRFGNLSVTGRRAEKQNENY